MFMPETIHLAYIADCRKSLYIIVINIFHQCSIFVVCKKCIDLNLRLLCISATDIIESAPATDCIDYIIPQPFVFIRNNLAPLTLATVTDVPMRTIVKTLTIMTFLFL